MDEIIIECKKDYKSNKKNINDFSLDEVNPIIGIHLSKRFMIAMTGIATIFEYLDHVMNIEDTKDTIFFLLIATVVLYTYQYALFYGPIFLVLKALHNAVTKAEYHSRKLDFQRSYRTIQRIMRDTSDYVEFFDLFMRNYVYWYNEEKTTRLIIELTKASIFGLVIALTVPLNYILIFSLWQSVLLRSHFFWWVSTVMKNFTRDCWKQYLGERFKYILDPPLEGLIDLIKEEENGFVKNNLKPFEIIPTKNDDKVDESDVNNLNDDGFSNDFFKRLFKQKTKKKNKLAVQANSAGARHYSENEDTEKSFQGTVKKQFDAFKQFTADLFDNKKAKDEDYLEVFKQVSAEDDLSSSDSPIKTNKSFENSLNRKFPESVRLDNKSLIQVEQKE